MFAYGIVVLRKNVKNEHAHKSYSIKRELNERMSTLCMISDFLTPAFSAVPPRTQEDNVYTHDLTYSYYMTHCI